MPVVAGVAASLRGHTSCLAPGSACGVDQGVVRLVIAVFVLCCFVFLVGQRSCEWPLQSLGAWSL
eukprot:4046149-Pyramimonas_sp.AAC.1